MRGKEKDNNVLRNMLGNDIPRHYMLIYSI